jgi:hypothetical protein
MPRKNGKRKIEDVGTVIDSVKVLIIEGSNLYIKLKQILKRTKKRKPKNDQGNIQN